LLALLIAGAVAWRFRMHRRQGLPQVVERGRVEGIPALNDGEFDRAYQLLSAARAAVDELGGNVEDADEIRRAAAEAEVFVNICSRTLEEILAEAGRTDPDAWAAHFDTLYKGQFCVFDTIIVETPTDNGGGAYELGYVVLPAGEASRFGEPGQGRPDKYAVIDLAGFELFEQAGTPRDAHVSFGARLRSMTYDSVQKHWVVKLEPKSGVIIGHHRALEAVGVPAPEIAEVPQEETP
jgi:hypothetical protein